MSFKLSTVPTLYDKEIQVSTENDLNEQMRICIDFAGDFANVSLVIDGIEGHSMIALPLDAFQDVANKIKKLRTSSVRQSLKIVERAKEIGEF